MAKECSSTTCSKESCEGCPSKEKKSMLEELNIYSEIKHVIGVVSGKGGVGKSFVTASLANQMAQKGFRVGILDADITGPSMPKMYGLHGPAQADDQGIYPMEAKNGIKVMSVNLLLPQEDEPVIWRGPILANMVKQFWTDVIWGDLDYLFVDMPPGTGDVPLTVFQSLPVDGIVMVTSPQTLVGMIVSKACKLAEKLNVPMLGLVENYSYIVCSDCGKKMPVFGKSRAEEFAAAWNISVLAKLPVDEKLAVASDEGKIESYTNEEMKLAVEQIVKMVEK